ncbi:hypothetical protein [Zestomonas carbonaria]|uniref:Uncharacterized protein n=1 Tax=Zestomonas carbonaria TaxID=2762745 RepID=A0A7U7EQ78_9GAMM|nr:hypothetical protein [Pseudomonas carbonaria]CAD5108763.1 hypothetical protein PSEWESI4_03055 [Pseudomonas carbonaria]
MSKILKWGLLSILAIAVLIKLSLWWSVRSIMDDAITRLSPFMHISYGSITSSFDGRVGLEKLQVRVPALRDSVRIGHAELKFNGLGELLRFKERLAEGKFPEQMALSLKGISLDVHGPFMQHLYDAPAERSLWTAMSEVACGKVRNIGTGELLDMGYRTFDTDAELSYQFKPGAKSLALSLNADTRDVLDMRFSLLLSNMSDNPGDLRANPPRLTLWTLELNDNQYQRKVQEFCAAKLGQSGEEYVQTALDHFDRVLRSQRIALDQPVLDGYRRYLQDPQSLRLELNPTEGMAWDGLQFFDAKDVIAMLRPTLLVNQQVVSPVGFAWVDPASRKAAQPVEVVAVEKSETARAMPQYEFVSVSSLADHAGKRLQFITYDGAYYQGILRKVENGKAYLSVQFGSGAAEMFLRLEKIDKVRVMF